ncbi:FKBP-type peptidyl-prolyl cis-trans isomerase [Spirosoma arcticum]
MNRTPTCSFWAYSLLTASVLLSSCQQPGEALTDRKIRENEEEINQYIRENNLTATKTAQGVYFIQTKAVPTGQAPLTGDEVKYHYITRRLDGVVVDSTNIAGNVPETVILNGNSTRNITLGRYAGLLNLKQGEEGSVIVPSNLDGGRTGSLLLPQYSPVRYDLRVVSIRTEDQQIEEYIRANKVAVTTKTDDGVRVAVTQARPDSVAITTGKTVIMTYKGKLLNGGIFDAGTSPLTVRIGEKQVVPGFETALTKLRAGEKALIIFPSALGYGATGKNQASASTVGILPYSPLLFEIEITKVQ